MQIVKATKKEREHAIEIAKNLKDWFSSVGLKNMNIDFKQNNLVVVKDKGIVLGFLCYSTYDNKVLIKWMGVSKEVQRKGIGQKLLEWLENESRKFDILTIEVETLPDEDDYGPYKNTRSFYYKNGFKRILYKKASVEGWDDQIVLEKIL